MDHAIDAGMMYADLTGGECLTYPGFREIYLHLRSRGIRVVILTNGQLITEELADFFAQYPPESIQMTVYGSNEDAYEAVTGQRAFEDVKQAIQLLKDRNLRTILTTTPSRYMQKDIGELLSFFRSTGVRYVVGSSSISARDDTGRKLSDYAPDADFYVRFHQAQLQFNEPLSQTQEKTSPTSWYIPKEFSPQTMLNCSSGQSTFHMNWKGEMFPCIPFHSVSRSVLEYGFENCWAWIKEQMKTYVPPSECMTCANRTVCDTCAAEQTMGILNGPLNKSACEKCEQLVNHGIIKLPAVQECL
jgi:MoaA/NifB/PqqE/SkfB family radical SAM enzyme